MKLARVQNVYYVVADMERAAAFYRDVLGLQLRYRDEERWAQFSVGGDSLSLSGRMEAAPGAGGAVAVLEVDDVDALRERLTAYGAAIVEQRDMGDHGRSLAFQDPDGNIVQALQRGAG